MLAHVDAGKTSLTESLLHPGGALDEVGPVDAGTTQTDTLAMERRRGITIRTAVATFRVGDVTVNLVDTPDHPDFIAEVDRSLAVLDGAVLVVSAVEGVQAQNLADIDPLIRLRPDTHHSGLQISVYGEIQQHVIADTLLSEYGIAADFQATTVICVERPARRAAAILRLGDLGHLLGFTLGVTVEPIAPHTGIEVIITADRLSLPLHVCANVEGFRQAVLSYLGEALAVGPHGWPVTDTRITVTDSGHPPAGPTPSDVRNTAVHVVTDALRRAGTEVCEPINALRVETSDDTVANVFNLLTRHRAAPAATQTADGVTVITGTVPTAEVDAIRAGISTAAHGQAVLESTLHHHTPIAHGPRR